MLEKVILRAKAEFGITAERVTGKTGIWVRGTHDSNVWGVTEEKLGAIGVHISRWVTSHGFAYNVSTDLRFFDLIVPCGITDRKATSVEKLLNRRVDSHEVAGRLTKHFGEVFGREMQQASAEELLNTLQRYEQLATPASDAPAQLEFAVSPASDVQQIHR